ncbi:rhomboid family intramembrane serine protease [Novipirellula artificiosorum]|uniref:Rhomboid family protein n=1 Tax=Novipirellula artificiosorum TaxID=2528016 RepID=A0A5C6D4L6_9BACT|nr:rhomboid family intramembrane serine protease [Novipirellula artificiosorum]TWU31005.1 Rhomboid family protein [Novipirellula artificiosorum]
MKKQAYPIMILLLVMWLVRIVDVVIPADLNQFGLQPRSIQGILGIGTMPFLHAGFGHLISNTVPLLILLGLTVASRGDHAWPVVAGIIVGSGVLLWMFGRNANHIGASGLVFGLIAFLITVGVREKRFGSIAVALLVGFLFGTTLFFGIIPSFGSTVSWDGHLFGAISGLIVGIATSSSSP